jgi:hypothetical protein
MIENVTPGTQTTDMCFKAALLNRARSVHPTDIPEDFEYFRAEGYQCPYVTEETGKQCALSDPMVFMQKDVGFVAIGTRNFCDMELNDPKRFKKEAYPSFATRVRNLGRDIAKLAHLR